MITQKIGDIRGMLLDADKRPVLRLLPELDEVCRGYVLNHLRDAGCSIEDIANQAWLLNATDWMRGQDKIEESLCKDLDYGGLDRELHEFAIKITEDLLKLHEKQGDQVSKESWELLGVKRRWIKGEISDKELDNVRVPYWTALRDTASHALRDTASHAHWAVLRAILRAVSRTALGAALGAAHWAAMRATEMAAVQKGQMDLLGDMLEDSVGIERGVKGKSLDSKVFGVSDGFG